MRTCNDCGVEESNSNFYSSAIKLRGYCYPVVAGSTAAKFCKECINVTHRAVVARQVKSGEYAVNNVKCSAPDCEGGEGATFCPSKLKSSALGFPVLCKDCDKRLRKAQEEALPPEVKAEKARVKAEKDKAASDAKNARKQARLAVPRVCTKCRVEKSTSEFKQLKRKGYRYVWSRLCKSCKPAKKTA